MSTKSLVFVYLVSGLIWFPDNSNADDFQVVSWNVESDGSRNSTIAGQIREDFEGVELWGLSEVASDAAAAQFEREAEAGEQIDLGRIVGTTGDRDRLVILFDQSKFELREAFELDDINVSGTVRAPLVARLRDRASRIDITFMVNHLYRGNSAGRHRQATMLNEWASQQTEPLIAVGDYNFDWHYINGDQDHDLGYDNMVAEGRWEWIRPQMLVPTNSSGHQSVLDFVFFSISSTIRQNWDASSDIYVRTHDFPDDNRTSDHRPVLATFEYVASDAGPNSAPARVLPMSPSLARAGLRQNSNVTVAPASANPVSAQRNAAQPEVRAAEAVTHAPKSEAERVVAERPSLAQYAVKLPVPELVEASALIRVPEARDRFRVNGSGLTAAVLDTGLRTTHIDFAGRVVAQRNFTRDNNGDANNAADGDGHGTNVGGVIVANGGPEGHEGIAPGAGIVPLKVLSNSGGGSFQQIGDGLRWVLENHARHSITVVNMSLGDPNNYQNTQGFETDSIHQTIRALRNARVAVVVSAGNEFFQHQSRQGMSYPAIFPETISVGAVYDSPGTGHSYQSGAQAFSTTFDQITPFSQRLHESVSPQFKTDIFGPGAPMRSAGIENDRGESVDHGTSQAAPTIAGVILLLQQFWKTATGELPSVDDLETWISTSAVRIRDDAGDQDNVENTGLEFRRVDALEALSIANRSLNTFLLQRNAR